MKKKDSIFLQIAIGLGILFVFVYFQQRNKIENLRVSGSGNQPKGPIFTNPVVTREPNMKKGDKFYVKTLNGKYVSMCFNCQPNKQDLNNLCDSVLCLKDEPYLSSVFI